MQEMEVDTAPAGIKYRAGEKMIEIDQHCQQ
jgi:hypothetical protein